MNSFCPKSKSLRHCLTELFPIYHNRHWTIRQRDNSSVDPSSHRVILMIVGFLLSQCIEHTQFFVHLALVSFRLKVCANLLHCSQELSIIHRMQCLVDRLCSGTSSFYSEKSLLKVKQVGSSNPKVLITYEKYLSYALEFDAYAHLS